MTDWNHMLTFKNFLVEESEEGQHLKHIHHAEDRPLLHGSAGFEHTHEALNKAHSHMVAKHKSSDLTMKYDGSPAVVFGHHPKTGKFFVASKSAFNKNPKINYSHEDIDKNHGHAPGLTAKLHAALEHLPKVAPKHGVYQGDLMHSHTDLHHGKGGKVSFTPNTITYTAHGDTAKKIARSKVGVVVHTKYHGSDIHSMSAHHDVDHEKFKQHPDVYHHTAEHDTSKISYPEKAQAEFHKHMAAAKAIHDKHGTEMYKATAKHHGDGGHLATYINHTVRHDETPTTEGLQKHIKEKYAKAADKVKTEKSKNAKTAEGAEHVAHIENNKQHYQHLLNMHQHLQKAKNVLVKHLETHEGGYEHHIAGKESKPEGFVVNHEGQPTKLVNRAEFAKQNLLKART